MRKGSLPIYRKKEEHGDKILDLKGILILIILCISWGINQVAIKVAIHEVPPLQQASIRSISAAILIIIWMKLSGKNIFERDGSLKWGMVIGTLFSIEFLFIYWGIAYTNASRSVIFMYLMPFFTAIGVHFFIPGDRLRPVQVVGLCCAFAGVVAAFSESLDFPTHQMLFGDALVAVGAVFWATITVTIKATPLQKTIPAKVLLYQLGFSALLLPAGSLIMGESIVTVISPVVLGCLIYQGIWVAFITYLAFFWLVHHYRVSRISSFLFLTPIFGVLAGAVILDEAVSNLLLFALIFVCFGVYLVNKPASK
jgi:drug/metabolite transporter (DMT)-like permease